MMRRSLALLALATVACRPTQGTRVTPAPAAAPTDSAARTAPARTASEGAWKGALSIPNDDPFPSTYRVVPSRPTLIRNATIMTATGPSLRNASILLRDGKIVEVGQTV